MLLLVSADYRFIVSQKKLVTVKREPGVMQAMYADYCKQGKFAALPLCVNVLQSQARVVVACRPLLAYV